MIHEYHTPAQRRAMMRGTPKTRDMGMTSHGMTQPKPVLGSGERFAALEEKIARRGDVRNPAAVAAAAGRAKYGSERMAKMSAAGRRRAGK